MDGAGETPMAAGGMLDPDALVDHIDKAVREAEEVRRGAYALYGFAGPEFDIDPSLGLGGSSERAAVEVRFSDVTETETGVYVSPADRRQTLGAFVAFMEANPDAYAAVSEGEAA